MRCNLPKHIKTWLDDLRCVSKDCKKCVYEKTCSDKKSNSMCNRFRLKKE